MLSMSISLIVLSSAVALFSVNSSFGGQHIQQNLLRAQLNLLVTTISDEIARAGFCYNCSSSNPYMLKGSDGTFSSILIEDILIEDTLIKESSCIRFAYNHNKRDNPATIHKDDAKGFRLGKDPLGNLVIEIYENRNELSNWDCSSNYWQDITNKPLIIDKLEFKRKSFSVPNSTNVLQSIELTISASLASDPSMSDTVTVTINVANLDG